MSGINCGVCHNNCNLKDGQIGLCRARGNVGGEIKCLNYGKVTSIALDPIEKKPLNLFYPGKNIVSVGSYGCNLRCPFCQNHTISYGFNEEYEDGYRFIEPDLLAETALAYKDRGNIGVAFTYNEPLVGYEYVLDAAKEAHDRGLKTVLVSNGTANHEVCLEVSEHIDAMNIDLKGFTDSYYEMLGGNRQMVMNFISTACRNCHMELTTLIIPGYNDREDEIDELAKWVANLNDGRGKEEIALHISRFFPRFHMSEGEPTPVETVYRLADVARRHLQHVFTGNC